MKELNKSIKCISRYKQNKQKKRKNNRILLSAFYHFILTKLTWIELPEELPAHSMTQPIFLLLLADYSSFCEELVRINDKKILSKFELLFLFFHLFSLYLVIHFIFLFNSFISEISSMSWFQRYHFCSDYIMFVYLWNWNVI